MERIEDVLEEERECTFSPRINDYAGRDPLPPFLDRQGAWSARKRDRLARMREARAEQDASADASFQFTPRINRRSASLALRKQDQKDVVERLASLNVGDKLRRKLDLTKQLASAPSATTTAARSRPVWTGRLYASAVERHAARQAAEAVAKDQQRRATHVRVSRKTRELAYVRWKKIICARFEACSDFDPVDRTIPARSALEALGFFEGRRFDSDWVSLVCVALARCAGPGAPGANEGSNDQEEFDDNNEEKGEDYVEYTRIELDAFLDLVCHALGLEKSEDADDDDDDENGNSNDDEVGDGAQIRRLFVRELKSFLFQPSQRFHAGPPPGPPPPVKRVDVNELIERFDRSEKKSTESRVKILQERDRSFREECTFHPSLSPATLRIMQPPPPPPPSQYVQQEKEGRDLPQQEAVHVRLHEYARRRTAELEKKLREAREAKERSELDACTFQPNLSLRLLPTSPVRTIGLRTGLDEQVEQHVQRQESARARREFHERRFAALGSPARVKALEQERAHHASLDADYNYADGYSEEAEESTGDAGSDDDGTREIDVIVSDEVKVKVEIRPGSDVGAIAAEFAQTHNLDARRAELLERALRGALHIEKRGKRGKNGQRQHQVVDAEEEATHEAWWDTETQRWYDFSTETGSTTWLSS